MCLQPCVYPGTFTCMHVRTHKALVTFYTVNIYHFWWLQLIDKFLVTSFRDGNKLISRKAGKQRREPIRYCAVRGDSAIRPMIFV